MLILIRCVYFITTIHEDTPAELVQIYHINSLEETVQRCPYFRRYRVRISVRIQATSSTSIFEVSTSHIFQFNTTWQI